MEIPADRVYHKSMDVTIGIPKRLGYLPLVVDVLRRTGLLDIIDQAVPKHPRSKVATSDCVAVMMCAIYSGHHDLWRMSDRLAQFDMPTIMQCADFDLSAFTEERLAKSLDQLYLKNPDMLMTTLAVQAISRFDLNTDFLNFDTTSLIFYGCEDDDDLTALHDATQPFPPPPMITFGHSKDHRPDLKQIMFGTLVTADGGIPIFGKALDGNASDSASAAAFFAQVRQLVKSPREVCCVADSKGWCARVLHLVKREKLRLLSRLPRNHSTHQWVMAQPRGRLKRVDRTNSRGKKTDEFYEIDGFDCEEILDLPKDLHEEGQPKIVDVKARAVRVFSSALFRRKERTLKKTATREEALAKRRIADWQGIAYACQEDADRAASRQQAEDEFITFDILPSVRSVKGPFKRGRGRPRKHQEPALESNHFRIDYTLRPTSDSERAERLRQQATFVLIRTRDSSWHISDEEMIERYKGQYYNEHGFAWLKSGPSYKGLNPLFLETPHRIASLCFLYVVGLMIWTIIQRTVRGNLAKWKQGLPYHRNKPSDRITTRFFFELFPAVQTVPYTTPDGEEKAQLVGVTETIQLACKALGSKLEVFKNVGGRK
jgi:transposase